MKQVYVSPVARAETRIALRMIAGERKPLVVKIGRFWYGWDGDGWVRPYRSWRGAMRAVAS